MDSGNQPLVSPWFWQIVKKGRQNIYKVHHGNYWGLFTISGLPGESFWQKVHFLLTAIEGVRVKKSCWAYLEELLKGKQRLFTELRYSIMFKSYPILNFSILAGSLKKKCEKFEFCGISGKLELVCQSLLNQAEIFTNPSLHQNKKFVVKEL